MFPPTLERMVYDPALIEPLVTSLPLFPNKKYNAVPSYRECMIFDPDNSSITTGPGHDNVVSILTLHGGFAIVAPFTIGVTNVLVFPFHTLKDAVHIGVGALTGTDTGIGTGAGALTGTGTGIGALTGTGTGTGALTGTGMGIGALTGTETGTAIGAVTGIDTGAIG